MDLSSLEHSSVYDLVGVGIGPFNLSLAALLLPVKGVKCLFLDGKSEFDWHPGLMFENADLQVPFLADLVSMIDPASPLSYLTYLKETERLYSFYFHGEMQIPRKEYNDYCKWASTKIAFLKFSAFVTDIYHENGLFQIIYTDVNEGRKLSCWARNIVLGTGTSPYIPSIAEGFVGGENCIHSSAYLFEKDSLIDNSDITIVGNGQSAAEIFLDLIRDPKKNQYSVNWITKSPGFFPMEHSKLGIEHFSPDYIDHFYSLDADIKDQIRSTQNFWYKGISHSTISEIYDVLYRLSLQGRDTSITLQANSILNNINVKDKKYILSFAHSQLNQSFEVQTDVVILATGYEPSLPGFLPGIKNLIAFDNQGRYQINKDYSLKTTKSIAGAIFVQNAEIHTHGVGAPDLGLSAFRSAMIINALLKQRFYQIPSKNVFQTFGISQKWSAMDTQQEAITALQ